MNCPTCGRLLEYRGTYVQAIFYCSTCRHYILASPGFSSHTTVIPGLVTRNWEDPPARTPVHPWYHDAFRAVEMLEP